MKNHAAGKCGGEREKWLFMIRCEIETFVKSYAWLMWHWVGVKSEKVGVKFPTGGIESGEAWWELIARMWWWIMTSCSEHFIPKNDAKRVSDKMKLIKSVCWRKMAFPPFFHSVVAWDDVEGNLQVIWKMNLISLRNGCLSSWGRRRHKKSSVAGNENKELM